jgi:tRNA pseudouridine55 synthase
MKILEGVSGFLPVDKPRGIAFSSVMKTVKRKFNLVKVGHGGSLDAYATGLFVIVVGDANRLAGEFMGADRSYEGTMVLGRRTDTRDVFGAVEKECAAAAGEAEIDAALASFKGDVFQTEPRMCTVRRDGAATYETADTGEHAPVLSHVNSLKRTGLEQMDGGFKRLGFTVSGTKNLMVRALAGDIGEELGCGAALETLRRTRIGRMDLSAAIPFEKILEIDPASFPSLVVPPAKALL